MAVRCRAEFRYRHSNWINGGDGWPWVVASAAEGLKELTLRDLKPGRYTVKLYFAELDDAPNGSRLQTIALQGKPALSDLDIRSAAKAAMTGIVHQIDDVVVDGALTITLNATRGNSLISGVEVFLKD